MKILVLDNYDSFTYNLVYLLKEVATSAVIDVVRNDSIALSQVVCYDKILLSPGPSLPNGAGIMKDIIHEYSATKSILGVCLGHQGIAEVFGAKLKNLPKVLHGHQGKLNLEKKTEPLFAGVPNGIAIGQYHSWAVDLTSLPNQLEVIATDDDGLVMGLKHVCYDVRGLQFHPESIMTENGAQILKNWINI